VPDEVAEDETSARAVTRGGRAAAGRYGQGKVSWGRAGGGGTAVARWCSGPVGIAPDSMQFVTNSGGRGSNQSRGESDLHSTRT
jgi:hypothetical protein